MTQRPKRNIKRALWMGKNYRILGVQDPSRQPLIGRTLRVERQLPDFQWPHPWLCVEGVCLSGDAFGQRFLLDGVRLERETTRQGDLCQCPAYLSEDGRPFPHRLRAGRCSGPPYCGNCSKHCSIVTTPEKHHPLLGLVAAPAIASLCCDAACFLDWQLTIPYEDET